MIMSNYIDFSLPFRFIDLKSMNTNVDSRLYKLFTGYISYKNQEWISRASTAASKFVEMVVATVKQTHVTRHQPTCNISLNSLLKPPSDSCEFSQTQHLAIIAQMLYRSHGIEIQQVDDDKSPQNIVVTWHRDNPWLNPASPCLVKSRKEGFRTDCTLKFGEKLFPVHGIVLAAKSPYFEKMFKSKCNEAELGATIPIVMEAVEEKSVEMLLDYFYTGELDLKEASITRIDNLANLSSYFDLPLIKSMQSYA
jgi:hypothetical protein